MHDVSLCPSGEELRQFAHGRLAEASAERVIQHLRQCRACLSSLEGVSVDDTLIEALRTRGAAVGDAEKAGVNGLIQRLKQLPGGATPDPVATAAYAPRAGASGERIDFLAPPQSPGEMGRLGGYRVLKVLGAGGMGMVFEAEDVRLKRQVALKVMKPELAANTAAKQRFLREAESSAAVRSDHVITIYQVGEQGDAPFLAMEYLEGVSLDDWLKKGRTPTLSQAARIGRQIALGLAAAHERGLIHRDIKPGNIWLESNHQGRVKLLDFGLARGTADEIHLTQSGAIVGTPAYMAPEQARGEAVDFRCDLFSLGVVLYRLTTGRLPFRGDNTMSILTSLAMDTPTPPRQINPDIPPRMAALIERLLSKDREQRPATAKAAADELATIERESMQPAADERTVVGAASVSERNFPGTCSRSRLGKYIAAAALLLVLGGVAAAIVVIIRDKHGKEVARLDVPKDGRVEIQEKDNNPPRSEAPPATSIEPEPLAPMAAGEPLSANALVRQPAKLPGVRSWSIALRETGSPTAAAYRPDGKRLAVGSWDGTVHIWEATTGRLLRVLESQNAAVALAWSPDGRVLAVGMGSMKRPVHLWEADTGRLLRTLETPNPDWITTLSWSPDGRQLRAWGGTSRQCYTWEVAKGKRLHSPRIASQCERPEFSPDGQRLAGTGDGNRILIWDADTGKEVIRLPSQAAVARLSWSPDGKRLAVTGADGLRVWDVDTRKGTLHYPKAAKQGWPIIWSPDGQSLAINLDEGAGTMLLDAASAEERQRLEDGGYTWFIWSPDGRTIARLYTEPWIRLYDSFTGKRGRLLTEGRVIRSVAASPDQQTLAVSDRFDTFLISTDTGKTRVELKQTIGPLDWSPDGKRLAAQGPDNAVQLWQASGKLDVALAEHKAEVTSLAWSPDGKRLASTAAGEKRVLLWNAVLGKRDRELGPFGGAAESVKWSADGRLLTFNVPEVGWHVWDLDNNRLVNDPKQWKVFWFDLTPDGRSALTAPSVKEVYRLRDLANGKDGARLPYTPVALLARPTWSADGTKLMITHYNRIEWWHADLSKWLRNLQLWGGPSLIVCSRDSKWLAALVGERLFIWEIDTGRFCGLLVLGRRTNALTITPEGHYTGNDNVDSGIVMVVEKDDGTQEMLEPAEFKRKYGFQNDPDKVHLLQPSK